MIEEIIRFRSASARIIHFKENDLFSTVSDLRAKTPNRGDGTGLMHLITRNGDRNHVSLLLYAQPYKEIPNNISEEKLIEFYKRFGFIEVSKEPKGYLMVRGFPARENY